MDSTLPTRNFGTATTLPVGMRSGSLGDRRAYLYFDASSVTAEIYAARLRLYVSDGTTTGPTLYGIENAWNETTMTWDTRPSSDALMPDKKTVVPGGVTIEWDVGSWVGEGGKYSFALIPGSTDTMIVASRENATVANRPTLILSTYATSNESARVFFATEDSTVDSSAPQTNFGTATTLSAQTGATTKQAYVKFLVGDMNTTATKAYLRLHVADATVNAPAVYVTSTTWSESTITWNNRPQPIGNPVANVAGAASGDYFDYDISSAVTVDATYAFTIIPESTDTLVVASTEGSQFNRPELIFVGNIGWRQDCGTNFRDQHCCVDKVDGSCPSRWQEVATDPIPRWNEDGNCKMAGFGVPGTDWSTVASGPVPTVQKNILVVALHGGANEPGTSGIALGIAARPSPALDHWRQQSIPSDACRTGSCAVIVPDEFWQCTRYTEHDAMHVESTKYVHAELMARLRPTGLPSWYQTVISVHGFQKTPEDFICVGGDSDAMRAAFINAWTATGSAMSYDALDAKNMPMGDNRCNNLEGGGTTNPVNMGYAYDPVLKQHGGLQLELPRSLRDAFMFNSTLQADFYTAIDNVFSTVNTTGP